VLKEAGILAAEIVGFPQLKRDEQGDILPGSLRATGRNGLVGYLTFVALTEPRVYLGFLARLLPLQINAHLDGQFDHDRKLTPEELREELLRRGLPTSIFGIDKPPPLTVEHQPQANGRANSGDGDDL
jgi:hypothetical protein